MTNIYIVEHRYWEQLADDTHRMDCTVWFLGESLDKAEEFMLSKKGVDKGWYGLYAQTLNTDRVVDNTLAIYNLQGKKLEKQPRAWIVKQPK